MIYMGRQLFTREDSYLQGKTTICMGRQHQSLRRNQFSHVQQTHKGWNTLESPLVTLKSTFFLEMDDQMGDCW